MGRSIVDIRAEIELRVRERANIWRQQSEGVGELSEIRAAIDHTIRNLWEELREARAKYVGLADFTPADVRTLIRSNPRLVLA